MEIVVGPVGSGKNTITWETLSAGYNAPSKKSLIIDPDEWGWERGKNRAIFKRCQTIGKGWLMNGGGIFFSPEFTSFEFKKLWVPKELHDFCIRDDGTCRFSLPDEGFDGSPSDFKETRRFQSIWKMCTETEGRCKDTFDGIKEMFLERTRNACLHRVETGKYKFSHHLDSIGFFVNENYMLEKMAEVTERNFEFQICLILFSFAQRIPIGCFSYDPETHAVALVS